MVSVKRDWIPFSRLPFTTPFSSKYPHGLRLCENVCNCLRKHRNGCILQETFDLPAFWYAFVSCLRSRRLQARILSITDTKTISQAVIPLLTSCQYAVLSVFTALYLFIISKTAFVLAGIFIAIAVTVLQRRTGIVNRSLDDATAQENSLYDGLTSMLDGFSQVRTHVGRNEALFEQVTDLSDSARSLKVRP